MTINLYDISEAISEEDRRQARLEKALEWILRKWERGRKGEEEQATAEEQSEPQEAH